MLQRLRLLWQTFTPVENAVLSAVVNALPSGPAEQLRAQIASINKVQRTLDWTEISFYVVRGGRVVWPEPVLFPNRSEFQLATAEYRIGLTRYHTTLYAVGGHVFSFVTRPSLRPVSFGRVDELAVTAVGDPLATAAGAHDFRRFHPPSYLGYWRATPDARRGNGWQVLKPDETYVVHLSREDYVVLAERAGEEFLLVPKREGAQIHHCVLGDDPRPVPGVGQFSECLKR